MGWCQEGHQETYPANSSSQLSGLRVMLPPCSQSPPRPHSQSKTGGHWACTIKLPTPLQDRGWTTWLSVPYSSRAVATSQARVPSQHQSNVFPSLPSPSPQVMGRNGDSPISALPGTRLYTLHQSCLSQAICLSLSCSFESTRERMPLMNFLAVYTLY